MIVSTIYNSVPAVNNTSELKPNHPIRAISTPINPIKKDNILILHPLNVNQNYI